MDTTAVSETPSAEEALRVDPPAMEVRPPFHGLARYVLRALIFLALVGAIDAKKRPIRATNPASSLTAWDAVSSKLTLQIMFWVVVLFLPLVALVVAGRGSGREQVLLHGWSLRKTGGGFRRSRWPAHAGHGR